MQVGEEVLGTAAKIEVSKESTTIVGDGSSEVWILCSPEHCLLSVSSGCIAAWVQCRQVAGYDMSWLQLWGRTPESRWRLS